MQCGFLLDVVVRQCSSLFQLLPSKYKPLLLWRNALLVLDLAFDNVDRISRFHFQRDSLASQCFHENLHVQLFLNTLPAAHAYQKPYKRHTKHVSASAQPIYREHAGIVKDINARLSCSVWC